jgi:hypothetical protein
MLQNYKAMYRPNFYESTCLRCNETVYQVDRVGPLKDFTFFHSGCFKCAVCGTKLTLKTYYNNQHRQEDKEVYCNSHVPKIGPGHLDGSSVGIRSALNVPKSSNFVNEQIRGPGRGIYEPESEFINDYSSRPPTGRVLLRCTVNKVLDAGCAFGDVSKTAFDSVPLLSEMKSCYFIWCECLLLHCVTCAPSENTDKRTRRNITLFNTHLLCTPNFTYSNRLLNLQFNGTIHLISLS